MDLNSFRVRNAPCTVYYIPDFITAEEEKQLLSRVDQAPRTKWTVLSHRRLQNWGGLPGPKGMVAEDLPQWLQTYCQKIADLGAFEGKIPNHVLVNEYLPGQGIMGIMPHEDGPAFYPTVSTITLGSHALLDFYYHLNALPTTPSQPPATQHAEGDRHPGEACLGDRGSEPALQVEEATTDQSSTVEKESSDKSAADKESSDKQCTNNISGSPKPCGTGPGSAKNGGHEKQAGDEDSSMDKRHFLSLLLQPRSLLLVKEDMYKVHLHGIKEVVQDRITDHIANLDLVPEIKVGDVMERGTRVSLTIRHVTKVLKSRLILGKR
ncbi:hypothetical protein ACOMHN_006449 [Nucella lapillus]